MSSLDEDFRQLVDGLNEPASLAASRSDPFYYFVYSPEQSLTVKRRIPVWIAQLREVGLSVERVCFSDLVWGWSTRQAGGRPGWKPSPLRRLRW